MLISLAIAAGWFSLCLNVLLIKGTLPVLEECEEEYRKEMESGMKKGDFIIYLVRTEVEKMIRQPGWQCNEERVPVKLHESIPLEATMSCTPKWSDEDSYHINIYVKSEGFDIEFSQHGPYEKP